MIFQRLGGDLIAGTINVALGGDSYLVGKADLAEDQDHYFIHRDEILSITNNPYDGTR